MILLNDFRRQWEDTSDAVLKATAAVGESGWHILGQQLRCFETALAAAWQVKYAVGVASGLDAIEICLKVFGCRPRDKVLTTLFPPLRPHSVSSNWEPRPSLSIAMNTA